jgi:hypothetical protein
MRDHFMVIPVVVSILVLAGCQEAPPPHWPNGIGSEMNMEIDEYIANDGVWAVPLGEHLARVGHNSQLHVVPALDAAQASRLHVLADLRSLIDALNVLNSGAESALFGDGPKNTSIPQGTRPVANSNFSAPDRWFLRAASAPSLNKFGQFKDAPTPLAGVMLMNAAVDYVNAGAEADKASKSTLDRLRVRAYVRSVEGGDRKRIHVAQYDDLTDNGVPPTIFETPHVQKSSGPKAVLGSNVREQFRSAMEQAHELVLPVEPRVGYINLAANGVGRGDHLDIIVAFDQSAVTSTKPSTPAPATLPTTISATPKTEEKPTSPLEDLTKLPPERTQTLEIDRLGVSWRLSADVLFVNRDGKSTTDAAGVTNDNDTNDFTPVPSASLTLHYHQRTGNGQRWDGFWNVWNEVDPGLGFNVAALSFEKGTEIGVGVHGSVLHDVFKIGYGYNLSSDEAPRYWYFGIGLFETLNELGKLSRGLKQ